MSAPASVEQLKADWLRDPCWDLEETDGFDGYHAHLLEFRRETEQRWASERANHDQAAREAQPVYWLKELVTEIRTMNAHLANIDTRLSYVAELIGVAGRI